MTLLSAGRHLVKFEWEVAKCAPAGCMPGAIGAAGLSDDDPVTLANGRLAYAFAGVIIIQAAWCCCLVGGLGVCGCDCSVGC